jgi:hypothetical protein
VVALVLWWAVHDHHADLATIIGKSANDIRVVIHKVRRELFLFDGLFSRFLVVVALGFVTASETRCLAI